MKQFHPAKKRIEVSIGESLRIVRELQELSQNQLARLYRYPAGHYFCDRERSCEPGCRAGKGSRQGAEVSSGRFGISGMGRGRENCRITTARGDALPRTSS